MLFIDSINGKQPTAFSNLVHYSKPLKVAPGKHTVGIRVRIGMFEGLAYLDIDVKSRTNYQLMREINGRHFTVWAVEVNSKESISSTTIEVQ